MNETVKKKWTETLKSGKFTQAQGCLSNENGHCCLGVLTELYLEEKNRDWDETYEGPKSIIKRDINLHPKVQEWAGLKGANPLVRNIPLSDYNDAGDDGYYSYSIERHDFSQIADLIENNL